MTERFPKEEHYKILEEWEEKGQKIRRVQVLATPVGENNPVLMEITYREIRPGFWQKVYGSEKFIEKADLKK